MTPALLLLALASAMRAEQGPPVPSKVIFVPLPQAYSLTKHPTLPVLYVGCSHSPEPKYLVTFRLDSEGKLIADSRRDWPDWFTGGGKNPNLIYTLWRPAIWPEKAILYLAPSPGYNAHFYTSTNQPEIVAVGLDADGLPTRPLRSLRTAFTGRISLMGLRCDSTTRRLYTSYYNQFGWCELDEQGLPVFDRFQTVSGAGLFWDWVQVPAWQRWFVIPGHDGLGIHQLADHGVKFSQNLYFPDRGYDHSVPCDNIEVSAQFRKLYLLRSFPGKELMVYSLTREGRLTGLPRFFELGAARAIRFDFQRGLLYAFSNEWMKTYRLDEHGHPFGAATVSALRCGELRDILVDEITGKVYVACTQPP